MTEIQQNMGISRQTSSQHLLESPHFLTCQPLTTQNPRELKSPSLLSHEFLSPQILPQTSSSWSYMALGKLGPWVIQGQGAERDPPPQTSSPGCCIWVHLHPSSPGAPEDYKSWILKFWEPMVPLRLINARPSSPSSSPPLLEAYPRTQHANYRSQFWGP